MSHSNKSSEYVNMLKKELSLLDTDEYIDKYGASETSMSEEGFEILRYIIKGYPESVLQNFDINKDYKSALDVLYIDNPDNFARFVKTISLNGNIDTGNVSRFDKNLFTDQRPIEDLIEEYFGSDLTIRKALCNELRGRFWGQSTETQLKMIKLSLGSSLFDREWAYWILIQWWTDSLIPDVIQAWEKYKDFSCVRTAAYRLPLSYIKEHQDEMGARDYESVCLRLAKEKDFVINKKRLFPSQYCKVMAINHILLDNDEAEQLLYGTVLDYIDPNDPWVSRRHYHNEYPFYGISERLNFRPTVINYKVKYVLWALGQTGNTEALLGFMKWTDTLQKEFDSYFDNKCYLQFYPNLNPDFQKDIWRVYVNILLKTIPASKGTQLYNTFKNLDDTDNYSIDYECDEDEESILHIFPDDEYQPF